MSLTSKKNIFLFLITILLVSLLLSCNMDSDSGETTQTVYVTPIWKGSLISAPSSPEVGWAYYNTTVKKSFIYDGTSWQILAQDGVDGENGVGITWKGELSSAPSNPQLNWAYYNTVDGNSYIYDGTTWNYLAKSGKDGESGILLWLGTYDSAPENPSEGWAYYNSTDGVSYIYSNDEWQILSKDGTNGTDGTSIIWKGAYASSPESPEENWAYYNTTDNTSYIYNGSSWDILAVSLGGDTTVTVSITWLGTYDTSPSNPQIGDAYYNSLLGASYVYDGSVWCQISKDGEDGADGADGKDGTNGTNGTPATVTGYLITWKGSYSSAPENPEAGWAYYDTTDKKSYIYDGSSWQILAQDGADGADGSDGSSSSSSSGSSNTTSTYYLWFVIYTPKGNYTQYATTSISEVDFGQIGLGSTAKSTNILIGISGTTSATLNLTGAPAIQISGDDSDQFVITQPSTTSVQTGTYIQDACIAFTPTSIGQKTATITIPNDSPDQPDFSFTITGTGSYYPKTFDGGEGDGYDAVTKILTDSSNNVYAIGYGWELANDHSGFDWWIKKFDSTGIEQWEKIFDFYDDDNSSYSPTYDNPKYAILDNDENLVISSSYNTVKLNSSGTELWELSTGGEIFCDSENNLIIGKSKYNSSGTLQWTNSLITTPVFDSSNNIYFASGSTIGKMDSDGNTVWKTATIDSTGRYNGTFATTDNQYLAYSVSSGNKYLLTWDDYFGTALNTETAYVYVSASYEDSGTSIISRALSGYGTYGKKFTASEDDNVVVNLSVSWSSYIGTYAIALYRNYESGDDFSSVDWEEGTLSTNSSETYSLSVTKGRPYVICANDKSYGDGTKTGRVEVSAEYSDGTSIFSSKSSTYSSPQIFFATQDDTITITVETYGTSSSYAGTYGIVMKELDYVEPKISGFDSGITNVVSICLDDSDNIYVAGYEKNKADTYSKKDIVIKKFSSDWTEITSGWDKTIDYGHCNNEVPDQILFDGTNIIMVGTGYDSISGSSEYDGLLYEYTTDGSLVTSFEIPYSYNYIDKDSSGNYYFSSGYYLLKYSSSGSLEWSVKHSINSPSVALDSDGYIYVGGYGSNLISTTSNYDWYIKKYSSDGVEQ